MERTVTVHDNDLSPISELRFRRIEGQNASISTIISLRPNIGSTELSLTTFVARLKGRSQISAHTGSSTDEVEEEVFSVTSLMQVNHRTATIQALGIRISVMDELLVGLGTDSAEEKPHQQKCEEDPHCMRLIIYYTLSSHHIKPPFCLIFPPVISHQKA